MKKMLNDDSVMITVVLSVKFAVITVKESVMFSHDLNGCIKSLET